MKYSALILAAGKKAGQGISYTKAFAQLKEDVSVLEQTVSVFLSDEQCRQIVIVTNSADMKRVVESHDSGKIIHVKGGETRRDSVLLGLTAVLEDTVLIHDGTRPWVKQHSIDRLLGKMGDYKAVVLGVRPKTGLVYFSEGVIDSIISRKNVVKTQTPQAYNTSFILNCYKEAMRLKLNVLDDVELVARVSDEKIAVVEGDRRNTRYIPKDEA